MVHFEANLSVGPPRLDERARQHRFSSPNTFPFATCRVLTGGFAHALLPHLKTWVKRASSPHAKNLSQF